MKIEDISVFLKWGKEVFTIETNTSRSGGEFKVQVMSLTEVPIEYQMIFGCKDYAMLQDEDILGEVEIKNGSRLEMIGSSHELFSDYIPPKEEEIKKEALQVNPPVGLVNLGNTCYANATIQALLNGCLGLKNLLSRISKSSLPQNQLGKLAFEFISLSERLQKTREKGKDSYSSPTRFIQILRSFSQFNEKTERGFHKQQDADEFFSFLMNALETSISWTSLRETSALE
ncbi:Ubiquitin carboxyl-terminal hydrolase 14-like protein, partial [Aduncisulcus paluster]